ncbi:MAG: hypothetical protein ACRD0P_39045 [Stackebrandtia sp.]
MRTQMMPGVPDDAAELPARTLIEIDTDELLAEFLAADRDAATAEERSVYRGPVVTQRSGRWSVTR